MKKHQRSPHIVQTISEWHQLYKLARPHHPLISVVDVNLLSYEYSDVWKNFSRDFYCISLKRGHNCKLRYGQRDYDFNEGAMIFSKPRQIFQITQTDKTPVTGYVLTFKADLIRSYPLAKIISGYGFFSYSVSEALHLSDSEEGVILSLMQQIQHEVKANIDHFSQDIIVSHIDLLLNYANRFYNRQFITRQPESHDLLSKLDDLLSQSLRDDKLALNGIPTVQFIAEQLNVSPNYLSDMLRSLTGQTTQQHIHAKLIDRAKDLLATTPLTVREIAYQLGFEYPQSFNKLFKNKINLSPSGYRQSFD